jgi:cation diffusion facilitator CzcD-associated flavoprotein CzcO
VSSQNGDRRRPSVGIVGAGFGGVGMAIRLRQDGFEDFTVFERGDSVGGVWRANSYPGAACDVPSHLYSFSFAPGHEWTRRYAPREDIMRYLEHRADEFGIRPHLRLETEVTAASFDEDDGRWTVTTASGDEQRFDFLVTAVGQLSRPAIPEIPGIEDFEGPAFHSAEWDHDVDLSGKRVAVAGTGASSIQFVPAIAPEAAHVTVYQRSAPWILPKPDRAYPEWEQRLFRRVPARVAVSRLGVFAALESATYALTGRPWLGEPLKVVADRYRAKELPDPELRRIATPDYEMGCKRVLFTSDWYSALRRPDVDLVEGGVQAVTPTGVVGPDGSEREADVIIYGTGFRSLEFIAPMEVRGLGGRELNEQWAGRAEAFLGTTVSGFPNMFVLYGPNTNHGAGSVPYTLECQIRYAIDGIRRVRDGGFRYLELRPEAQARWRAEMEERSRDTVWLSGGCSNWYVTADGINTNNWPGPWLEFRRRTQRLNPGDYRVAV